MKVKESLSFNNTSGLLVLVHVLYFDICVCMYIYLYMKGVLPFPFHALFSWLSPGFVLFEDTVTLTLTLTSSG